jgi:hypothetical protein
MHVHGAETSAARGHCPELVIIPKDRALGPSSFQKYACAPLAKKKTEHYANKALKPRRTALS